MSRRLLVIAGVPVAIALGVVAETGWPAGIDGGLVVADLAVGWLLIGSGFAVWWARPSNRMGSLLVITGATWFAGTFFAAAAFLHRGSIVHVLAAHPTGRLSSAPLRVLVVSVYFVSAVAAVSRLDPVGVSIGLVVVALGLRLIASVRRPVGRRTVVSGLFGVALGLDLVVVSAARMAGATIDPNALVIYQLALVGTGLAVAAEVIWRASPSDVLTRVVVDLGGAADAGTLRDQLARAVGDPSLLLGYAVDGEPGAWVDDAGTRIAMPAITAERSVTPIAVDGRALGFVAHDPAYLGDPQVIGLIASAAGLAISNSATQVEIRRRVAEVDASRERLVHAGDAQGRHLESALENGAIARLGRVADLLRPAAGSPAEGPADPRLAEMLVDLETARGRLREFAQGVYPPLLRSGGLAAGIRDLAGRSPIPVETVLQTTARFDPAVESTLYFVCAEALVNAAKHAKAGRIRVELAERLGGPDLRIADDGIGGASLVAGSGLRGLTDRVEALGGSIALASRPGAGTTLTASVPRRRPGPGAFRTSVS